MRKIVILALVAVMGTMAFTGCDVNTSGEAQAIFDGFKGDKGDTGLSAYEVAVENGFSGTETEWLESLRGEAGVQGIDGLDGLSAYQLWVLAGNEGTEADFFNSLRGEDGANGLSAYEIWLSLGNTGTETEFIASLTGPAGQDGQDGQDGVDGQDGNTAFVTECPVLEPVICEVCPDPLPVIVYDGNASMSFHTTAQGWTNIKVGHLIDNAIVEYDDAITTNDNGVLGVDKVFDVGVSGTHIIGIQFDN